MMKFLEFTFQSFWHFAGMIVVIVLAIYQAVQAILVLISTPRVKPLILCYVHYGEFKIKMYNSHVTCSNLQTIKDDILKVLSK